MFVMVNKMVLTTLTTPVSVRVSWTAVEAAWTYRVMYKLSSASAYVVHERSTPGLSTLITHLTPGETYDVEVFSMPVNSVTLTSAGTATVTLPASSLGNFAKAKIQTDNTIFVEYDADALTPSVIGEAAVSKSIFSAGDKIAMSSGFAAGTNAQFVNVAGTASVDTNTAFYVPFETVGETVTLSTTSGDVTASYTSANKITIDGVEYQDDETLFLGGQRLRVRVR